MLEYDRFYKITEVFQKERLNEIRAVGTKIDEVGLGTQVEFLIEAPGLPAVRRLGVPDETQDAVVVGCFIGKVSRLSLTKWHFTADPLLNDVRVDDDDEINTSSIAEVVIEISPEGEFVSGTIKFVRLKDSEDKKEAIDQNRFN